MKRYRIKVTKNPDYCGVGAASLQFAHGTAETANRRAADWCREHQGYEVEEVAALEQESEEKSPARAKKDAK